MKACVLMIGFKVVLVTTLIFMLASLCFGTDALDTLTLSPKQTQINVNTAKLSASQSEIVLHSEDWQGRAFSLPDLLAEQAGVETRKYGGIGSFQTISIRGATGTRLMVYLDGVPLNSAGGGSVDLGKINLDGLERIEIRKGIAPASEGGNGMGGVVHLFSKSKPRSVQAILGTGSFGYQHYSLASSANTNVHTITGNIAWTKATNDFSYLDRNHTPYNTADDTWVRRQNSQYQGLDWHVQGGLNVNSSNTLRVKIAGNQNAGGLPGDEGAVTQTAGFKNHLYENLLGWEIHNVNLEKKLSTELALDEETPEFHWTKADPIGLTLGRDTVVIQNRSARSQLRLHGNTLFHLPKNYAMGIEMLSVVADEKLRPVVNIENSGNPNWKNRRQQISLASDFTFEPDSLLKWTLGVNGEYASDQTEGGVNYYGDTLFAGVRSRFYPSGRFGVVWQRSEHYSVFSNVGKFYHMPSLMDRFGGRWGMIANPNLENEEGINFEGGGRFAWQKGFIEVCAFQNQVTNAIFYQHSVNLIKAINLDATVTRGIEFAVNATLPLSIAFAYSATFQKGENESQTYYSGLTLPDAPLYHHHAKIQIPLFQKLSLEQVWELSSKIYRDPGNIQIIPAQNLWNANLRYTPIRQLQFDLTVKNMTDTYYEDVYSSFPYPGRNLNVTVTGKL